MTNYIPYNTVKKIWKEMPRDYAEILIKETLDEEDVEELMKGVIAEEDLELLTFFIEMGVDLNRGLNQDVPWVSEEKDSYLSIAIREDKTEVAKCLIDKGIAFKKPGDIAYMDTLYAVQCERLDIFKYLVEHGADVNVSRRGENEINVFTFVKMHHQKEMMKYLVTIKDLFCDEKQKELEKLRLRLLLYR